MRLLKFLVMHALCALCFYVAAGPVSAAEAPRPKRVLIVSTGSRIAPGFMLVDRQLLEALGNIPSARIETYTENLDILRFPSERFQRIFNEYLTAKYAEHPPDLVILVYVGNLGIAGKLLPQLFPGTPIVVAGLTEEEIRPDQFTGLVSGVAQRADARGTLELILRLQPEVRRVVVIGGTAEVDRQVLQRVREAARSIREGIRVDVWDNLRMADLRAAVAALPRDSAVLFTRFFRDAAGQAFVSGEVGRLLSQSASVPVYVMTDVSLGSGAVGGAVTSIEALGKRAGEMASAVLTGADIKSLSFEIRTDGVPTFDWRALKRWGISESRLPPNSIVRFRPQSLWEEYRWYILGAFIIICVQSAMIVVLILQRRRRRRIEAELRETQRLMELAASAGELGLWSRDLTTGDLWANQPMRSLFGLGAHDMLRFDDLSARVHPDDRAHMLSEVERAEAAGLPFEGEFRTILPGGEERWVLARGRAAPESRPGRDKRRLGVVLDITERKRAEKKLLESENRFRTMANTAPVMIWMSGTDKLCTFFNKGWLDFTGRTLEQELGNGWLDGVHREDFDRCFQIYVNAFDARQEFTMEYRLRRWDGEYPWILDHGVPRFEPDGTFLGYIGTAIDITELKRGEEKFRLAVEASPNAIVMVNPQGEIVLVNEQTEKLFGYTRAELIGQPIEMLLPDRFRRAHPGYRTEFFAHPEARPMGGGRDLFARRKDGSEIMVEIGLNPIQTYEGLFVLTAIVDVSAREQAEEALKKERAFLRQVIDINPNFIFAKDRQGRFTLVNQAVADAYGTTVDDLIGKTDADFNPNRAEVESFRRMDLEVMDTLQEHFIPEEHITDAQGKVRWLQTVKRPILEKDGSAQQVLGASTDITRRKETEFELQEQRAELAHVARISTMGELAASLAHELNQPLTAILSNAQAALRFMSSKPADLDEVREILQDIVKDNSRAGEVIRRMRALVKKEELEFATLDLASLIRDVVILVRSDAILQNVRISLELDHVLPPVRGDRVQLQQVLLNIMLNAFDAMKQCPPRDREVKLQAQLQDASLIKVAARDRGTGLSADKLDKIFQPFYTTKGEGLGMGLSICRSIIVAHGGRLWAENNPDRGATFYFTVPMERSDE